ncbi:hypothetical protein [Pontiella desulfatans]|uniref:hypothetical protein n=1 Tax=Pontiella desulfatans TaxID=2750659 RepID=UPI00109D5564|nr:hypothetical protein [Pontiella desulfatans]
MPAIRNRPRHNTWPLFLEWVNKPARSIASALDCGIGDAALPVRRNHRRENGDAVSVLQGGSAASYCSVD